MKILCVLMLLATPTAAQVKQAGFLMLPETGSANFGPEAAAQAIPGFFGVQAELIGDRNLVDGGGIRVFAIGGEIIAEIDTSAGTEILSDICTGSADVLFEWDNDRAALTVGGLRTGIDLLGEPTLTGELSAGRGLGPAVALTRWRIGSPFVYIDGFESGDLGGWGCIEGCEQFPDPDPSPDPDDLLD